MEEEEGVTLTAMGSGEDSFEVEESEGVEEGETSEGEGALE